MFILFAGMIGAFDKINRERIWEQMGQEGVSEQLRKRI